jgi:glycosyltransferase involved in cell wall biosynthesis
MHDAVIIICTFNNARLLDGTLASLEQQVVRGPWSALVVDNHSTDDTPAVVQRYIERRHIPNLRYVYEPRQGLSYARRRGVEETSQELIAFVDDDTCLDPNWLRAGIDFFRARPAAGAIGGRIEPQWEVPPSALTLRHAASFGQDYGDLPVPLLPDSGPKELAGAGLVLRRSALRASGWLDSMVLVGRQGGTLSAGEDTEIIYRIRRAGYELWYEPAMRMRHCIAARRMTEDYLCRLIRGNSDCHAILRTLRENRRPTLPWRLRIALTSAAHLARLLVSIAADCALPSRREAAPDRWLQPERRVALHRRWAMLAGATRFLFGGYRQLGVCQPTSGIGIVPANVRAQGEIPLQPMNAAIAPPAHR